MEYLIEFIEIEISHIIIKITPTIKELPYLWVNCFLNCRKYADFTMQGIDEEGTLYKIIPKEVLKIYDEIGLCLNATNVSSNYIKVHLCKEYMENKGLFVFKAPNVESGKYILGIESLNDTNFIRRAQDQVICNGVNKENSSINSDKILYSTNENINLKINIIDKNDKNAPDGNYFLYIKIEEIF